MRRIYPKLMRAVCIVLSEKFIPVSTQMYICKRVFNLPDLTFWKFQSWRGKEGICFPQRWTQEVKDYMAEQVRTHSIKETAALMREKFEWPELTAAMVKGALTRYGIKTGRTGRFEKGSVSLNKGKKPSPETIEKIKGTWFKKGHLPHNTLPIGAIVKNSDGYMQQKFGEDDWRLLHLKTWEDAHGPVPKGYCVIFLDGDTTNYRLENLALISQRENVVLNHHKLRCSDPELTKTGIKIAKLRIALIDKNKKGNRKCI